MATPTVAWSELSPADSDNRYAGEQRIRELKTQIRELINIDHQMDYVSTSSQQDDDWGWHKTLTLLENTTDPTAIEDTIILYSKHGSSGISESFIMDEDGNVIQLTHNNNVIAGMIGEVRMWKGTLAELATIPDWYLCDGLSGRPNLIDKFVRGIRSSAIQPQTYSGGSNTITLEIENLPSHSHTVSSYSHYHNIKNIIGAGSYYENVGQRISTAGYSNAYKEVYTQTDGSHSHVIGYTGSSASYDHRPAYFEIAYIIKTE